MVSVNDLLRSKGRTVHTVAPEASVFEALELMAREEIGGLVVTEADRVVGMFTERDYARKVILEGKSSRSTRVREIMTPRVYCVSPSDSVQECMALMTGKHIRHLPVLEGRELVGLISIGDVVKSIIEDQQFTIEQLERYITTG